MIYPVGRAEGFQIAQVSDALGLHDRMHDGNGAPLGGDWSPPATTVCTVNRGKRLAAPDVFCGGGITRLVFTTGAARSMRDILDADGELLPLASSHPEGLLLHNTRVIDRLDLERSEARRFPDSDRVMAVMVPALRVEPIGNADMLVIPQEPASTLVTSAFVQRVEERGLKGLSFKPYFDGHTPYMVGFDPLART